MRRNITGAFRLELQAQTQLWGVVESLVTLPAQSPDVRDVILLTFRWVCSLSRHSQSPQQGQVTLRAGPSRPDIVYPDLRQSCQIPAHHLFSP